MCIRDRASAVCDEMIGDDREDFYAYVLRQKCAFELYNGQGVVDDFYQAKTIWQGYAPIYELAADVFIRYSQYEDAKGILNQAEEAGVSSPKPVSYTHLDVYKRQGPGGAVFHPARGVHYLQGWDGRNPRNSKRAVSYTHLDVYKRQRKK